MSASLLKALGSIPSTEKRKLNNKNMLGCLAPVLALVILATWEAEIGRISVRGQPGQIVHEIPISKISRASWVLVAPTCNPSYSGGRDQEDHSSKPARANSS
jgi:hypothetical protein